MPQEPRTENMQVVMKVKKIKESIMRFVIVLSSFLILSFVVCSAPASSTKIDDDGTIESPVEGAHPLIRLGIIMAESGLYDQAIGVFKEAKDYYPLMNPAPRLPIAIVATKAAHVAYHDQNSVDYKKYITIARNYYGSLVLINMNREYRELPLLDLSMFNGIEDAYEDVRD